MAGAVERTGRRKLPADHAQAEGKSFCFTWWSFPADWRDKAREWVEKLDLKGFSGAEETAPTTGQKHIQGWCDTPTKTRVGALGAKFKWNARRRDGTKAQNATYVSKEGEVFTVGSFWADDINERKAKGPRSKKGIPRDLDEDRQWLEYTRRDCIRYFYAARPSGSVYSKHCGDSYTLVLPVRCKGETREELELRPRSAIRVRTKHGEVWVNPLVVITERDDIPDAIFPQVKDIVDELCQRTDDAGMRLPVKCVHQSTTGVRGTVE